MAANSPLGPRFARENAPDSGISRVDLLHLKLRNIEENKLSE
jgi:hypothetical protein